MPHVYGRVSYRLQKSPAVHCPEVSAEKGGCGISGAVGRFISVPRLAKVYMAWSSCSEELIGNV